MPKAQSWHHRQAAQVPAGDQRIRTVAAPVTARAALRSGPGDAQRRQSRQNHRREPPLRLTAKLRRTGTAGLGNLVEVVALGFSGHTAGSLQLVGLREVDGRRLRALKRLLLRGNVGVGVLECWTQLRQLGFRGVELTPLYLIGR